MKIKEIIEKLEEMNPEADVLDYNLEVINCVYEDEDGNVIIEHEY